ncbi:MAG: hypothetical protein A3K83_07020 [Omnitrophica WOR_2 bacterium RBG_13_44_8b]|nr:MAG: hypothetical protein A3K83_07020 [Omnitrophica WOR_2 bacterium RBG_13_44_8b]
MRACGRAILVMWCVLFLVAPLSAEAPLLPQGVPLSIQPKENSPAEKDLRVLKIGAVDLAQVEKEQRIITVDRKIFSALYNKPKVSEKELVRAEWQKAFGFDVWYPYYKTKEIEDWVSEKVSIKVFNLKGKPKFENGQIKYTFLSKF